MEPQDLNNIVQLCMEEYGQKNRTNLADQLDQWWLQLLIDSTMRMKLAIDSSPLEKDHTILVATQQMSHQSTSRVVGMIEVSWQPVLPDRIPPAVPIPLSLKKMYCQIIGIPLQAWIGNLLIEPSFRRRGLAKLLVAATEGIAGQRIGCTSLHLHCDAQYSAAQRLYQSMGYRIIPKDDTPFTFDGGIAWRDSIHFVDGVALLYLQKDIDMQGGTF
jgi:RimJ/RimL family protein N-acetyltransferase